eukprot:CAMPEP_0181212658 /NCGR_PEP_ID=MMETSP1096-20121128/24471_1 /TAXON_ID=156174 ORGANISM="Chrysochromulina ericina, Strain CCMP281" /NCGR_SAMPLE_ID=MMETSP1096 /ASSEMBLY_ACC=CAM_ASM_000453 /LENGTH=99 /DNA_ID=CAMNT_0023304209 /DNA_START=181 /DNA_END=480 /DNA_ORIENTATION=-
MRQRRDREGGGVNKLIPTRLSERIPHHLSTPPSHTAFAPPSRRLIPHPHPTSSAYKGCHLPRVNPAEALGPKGSGGTGGSDTGDCGGSGGLTLRSDAAV